MDELNSSTAMSNFFPIADLIRFVMNVEYNPMKGSVHEDDFYIVRDDSVLIDRK